MMKKKLLALGLSVAMVGSLVACGDSSSNGDTEANATPTVEANGGDEQGSDASGLGSAAEDHSSVPAGSIIDFEDGNYAFASMNDSDWNKDADSEISVADELGSKVLEVSRPNGTKSTGIAIDIVSLLGDKVGDCATVKVDIGVAPTGDFAAVSGNAIIYAGESNSEVSTTFSIYKPDAACKTVTIDLSSNPLVAGAQNYFTIGDLEDTATSPANIYIDNIICLDASGNPIALDSSAEFAVEGVGSYDWSGTVVQPVDEVPVLTPNTVTGGGWWPDATCAWAFQANDEYPSLSDLGASFGEGDVITIYYSIVDFDGETSGIEYQLFPYLRAQNWPGYDEEGNELADDGSGWNGGIVDINANPATDDAGDALYEDDHVVFDGMVNNSYSIAQYTYEDVQAAFDAAGATGNWQDYCDFFGIADRGMALKIIAVTIGKLPQ